jgi:hypothetical protein
MSRKRSPRLFEYRTEKGAARTLAALRAAWPQVQFSLMLNTAWRWNIEATTPTGWALVKRAPIASFGTGAMP